MVDNNKIGKRRGRRLGWCMAKVARTMRAEQGLKKSRRAINSEGVVKQCTVS